MNKAKLENFEIKILFIFEIIAACFCIYLLTIGFDNSILDKHAFRQTQTALTAIFLDNSSSIFKYQTPILGYPWLAPYEFPLYQYLVNLLYKSFDIRLESAGRLFSIFSFFLTIVSSRLIFREFFGRRELSIITLLILSSPTLIFWSRTFMIESLALALSLYFLLYLIRFVKNSPSKSNFIIFTLLGIAAGLTKITTFIPFLILAFSYVVYYVFKVTGVRIGKGKEILLKVTISFFCIFLISSIWVYWTDYLKSFSLLAQNFKTRNLKEWSYGTLSQKTNISLLRLVVNRSMRLICGVDAQITLILSLYLLLRKKYYAVFLLFIWFLPLFVFFNLYYRHDYYSYANSIFLLSFFAIGIKTILEQKKFNLVCKFIAYSLLVFILCSAYQSYFNIYLPYQVNNNSKYKTEVEFIEKNTNLSQAMLQFQGAWSSELAFLTKKKTLSLSYRHNQKALEEQQKFFRERNIEIGTVAVCPPKKLQEIENFEEILQGFNFRKSKTYLGKDCIIFIAEAV